VVSFERTESDDNKDVLYKTVDLNVTSRPHGVAAEDEPLVEWYDFKNVVDGERTEKILKRIEAVLTAAGWPKENRRMDAVRWVLKHMDEAALSKWLAQAEALPATVDGDGELFTIVARMEYEVGFEQRQLFPAPGSQIT